MLKCCRWCLAHAFSLMFTVLAGPLEEENVFFFLSESSLMLLCDIRMCHFLQSAKRESHNEHTKVDTDLHYNHSAMQPAQAQATLVKSKQTVQLSSANPCDLSIKQKDRSEV